MSQDDTRARFDLSRRKLLGSVATLGAAGAIGGAGTMAFFSDEENFANNQLTAGELDLKVDWQEHYSVWAEGEDDDIDPEPPHQASYGTEDDETYVAQRDGDAAGDFEVLMVQNQDPTSFNQDNYVGLPTPDKPMVAVPNGYVDDFLTNIAVEAFPDNNDDGVQDRKGDASPDFSPNDGVDQTDEICDIADANLPAALDSDYRTQSSRQDPVINLQDVKPGDFGDLTMSFHLCDNDGYVWMQAGNVSASENGVNEPEGEDPQEQTGIVELLDAVQVQLWYDWDAVGPNNELMDGDNLRQDVGIENYDATEQPIVRQASLRAVLNLLQTTAPGQNVKGIPLDGNPYDTASSTVTCNSTTDDGVWEVDFMADTSQTSYSIGPDDEITISNINRNANGTVQDFFYQADPGKLDDDFLGICTHVRGLDTDGDATEDSTTDGGAQDRCDTSGFIGLAEADPITSWRPNICQRTSTGGNRDCFIGSNTYHIGLAWWLPVDHANEIQSDSVEFDLGFYTEQCRHNDGSGQLANN